MTQSRPTPAWSSSTACFATARWDRIAPTFAHCRHSGTRCSSPRLRKTAAVPGRLARSPGLRGLDGGRRDLADAQIRQGVAHRIDGVTHLVGPYRADAPDPEGFELRQLAGIENEALVAHLVVERLERIARVRRRMEGHDNRRLDARIEKRPEAHFLHPCDQGLAV